MMVMEIRPQSFSTILTYIDMAWSVDEHMRILWQAGATVIIIGVILLAIPPEAAEKEVVHEGEFVLWGESTPIVTLKLSEGEYEIWVKDIDGFQRENQFIGLSVLDSSSILLDLTEDTAYTIKLVDNATIERHSRFSVEKERSYTIMAYTWDASHIGDEDHIRIEKLASDSENPFLLTGIACLIIGMVMIMVSARAYKNR
jgi:hypothetical protein